MTADDPRVQRAREAMESDREWGPGFSAVLVRGLLDVVDEQGALLAEDRSFRHRAIRAEAAEGKLARVQALADEWATAVKRYQWCGDCGAPEQERIELLAAINGEEVTE